MKKLLFSLIFIGGLFSCQNKDSNQTQKKSALPEKTEVKIDIDYATGFEVESYQDYDLLIVKNSWPNSDQTFTYVVTKKEVDLPQDLKYTHRINLPIKRSIVTSTTHIPSLIDLNVLPTLVAFPEPKYISSDEARKYINKNKILNIGQNQKINTELAIATRADVFVGFSMNGKNKAYDLIENAGIPVVYNGDWVEKSPLGKAEWIKFFGVLFGKKDEALKAFGKIEKNYNEMKLLAQQADNKPSILSGSLYRDVWYLPGGSSWQTKFFEDANINYIYADNDETGSLSLSFESVLNKAQDADIWISPGSFTSYDKMIEQNPHYKKFKAFQNKEIYGIAGKKGETGGVIYYELAPNRPDLVLRDLIKICHPDLIKEHEFIFFQALK